MSLPLIIVTFDKDPDEFFCKAQDGFKDKLMTNKQRLNMLASLEGVDDVYALETSLDFFAMSPNDFLAALKNKFNPAAVYVGEGFRFGRHNKGNTDLLQQWSAENDCTCTVCGLLEAEGGIVSSTRIRTLLKEGNVACAKRLFGEHCHSIFGKVIKGRGEGSSFGFATANLDMTEFADILMPKEGVYGGYAMAVDAQENDIWSCPYPAAINVGKAKSFARAQAELEAHILNIDTELYGHTLRIDFVEWLREQRVFKDKSELITTVQGNIDWVRTHLGGGLHGKN